MTGIKNRDRNGRVVVHLHVTAETRTLLRMLAASRGTSVAEMIARWAAAEAQRLGLAAVTAGAGRVR